MPQSLIKYININSLAPLILLVILGLRMAGYDLGMGPHGIPMLKDLRSMEAPRQGTEETHEGRQKSFPLTYEGIYVLRSVDLAKVEKVLMRENYLLGYKYLYYELQLKKKFFLMADTETLERLVGQTEEDACRLLGEGLDIHRVVFHVDTGFIGGGMRFLYSEDHCDDD